MRSLFIVWQKEYETGIPILDEQHRGLISLINSFFFHRGDLEDINRILVPTIEMFKSYARISLVTVERLMKDSKYPEIDKFKDIHKSVLANIEMNERKYRKRLDPIGFLQYLKEYWMDEGRARYESEYIGYLRQYYEEQMNVA